MVLCRSLAYRLPSLFSLVICRVVGRPIMRSRPRSPCFVLSPHSSFSISPLSILRLLLRSICSNRLVSLLALLGRVVWAGRCVHSAGGRALLASWLLAMRMCRCVDVGRRIARLDCVSRASVMPCFAPACSPGLIFLLSLVGCSLRPSVRVASAVSRHSRSFRFFFAPLARVVGRGVWRGVVVLVLFRFRSRRLCSCGE